MTSAAFFDVVVIGGGAAGLMCALTAGQRGRRVALLEHNDRVGKKIVISGGGRCNFTNIHAGPENFLSEESGLLPLCARALYSVGHHSHGGKAPNRLSREEARPIVL